MNAILYRPVPGFVDLYARMDGTILKAGHGELEQKLYPRCRYFQVQIPGGGCDHTQFVHSLVAAAFFGERPDGIVVRHGPEGEIDNSVVNLCYGTPAENIQDSIDRKGHHQTRKTHCPQGHPYSPENTYIDTASGGRRCRTCRAAQAKEYHSKPEYRRRHAELQRARRQERRAST